MSAVARARSRLANEVKAAKRRPDSDPDHVTAARRDLAAAKLEDYIRRVVAAAPELSLEQRHRLSALLRGPLTDGPTGEGHRGPVAGAQRSGIGRGSDDE